MSETDLALVTTEELWEEIKKRHEGCVLLTVVRRTAVEESRETFWHGGLTRCIGLLRLAEARLTQTTLEDLDT